MSVVWEFLWTRFMFGVNKLNYLVIHMDFNSWMIVLVVGVVFGFVMLRSNLDSIKP